MNWSEKITVPTQVLAREVGDEVVILDLASGMYFGLDPVGARIWQLVAAGATPHEACAGVVAEYEVEEAVAKRDVERLLEELAARGLIAPLAQPDE